MNTASTDHRPGYVPDDVQRLVAWCRTHDWGREAVAGCDLRSGQWEIAGLLEAATFPDGTAVYRLVSIRADRRTIRDWAGY